MEKKNRNRDAVSTIYRRFTDSTRRALRWPRSYRLTFTFDEQGLRMVRRTPRLQSAPPSDALDQTPKPNAIVAEIRSPQGVAIYRKRLHDPIPQDAEVFDKQGIPTRVKAVRSKGTFSVIVPNVHGSDFVVIDAGQDVVLAQSAFAERESGAGRWVLLQERLKGGQHGR